MGFGFNSLLYVYQRVTHVVNLVISNWSWRPHMIWSPDKKKHPNGVCLKAGYPKFHAANFHNMFISKLPFFGASSVFSHIHFRWVKPMNPHFFLLLVNIPFWGFEHHLQSYLLEVISIFPFCWVMFMWDFNHPPGIMSPIHHIGWCPPSYILFSNPIIYIIYLIYLIYLSIDRSIYLS